MTPTEFEFTVQIPGDTRLVGAIRQLTAHAAGYAQLAADASEQLAEHVERATETAISASVSQTALIEYRFSADSAAILVVCSCDVAPSTPHPAPVATRDVTVEWTTEGTRRVCRIRHRLARA